MRRLALAGVAVAFALMPAPAVATARFFGFNDNASLTHDLSVDDDARLLAATGADSARITVDWSWVEQRRASST